MIAEGILLKQITILLLSAVKLMVAIPLSTLLGYSYLQTFLNTAAGGILGVLFFFFLSKSLLKAYQAVKPLLVRQLLHLRQLSGHSRIVRTRVRQLRKFTKRNRMIIKIRSKYGMAGIIILTPIILSIPLGTFLAIKYYSSRKNLLAWLSLSVIVWSAVISSFIELFWTVVYRHLRTSCADLCYYLNESGWQTIIFVFLCYYSAG